MHAGTERALGAAPASGRGPLRRVGKTQVADFCAVREM